MRRVLLLTLAFVAVACGGSKPPAADASAAAATPATTPAATPAATAAPKIAPAVDFEKLVALLPEASGWTRSKPRGEQVNMGAAMSHAQAEYQKGESSIDLEITDSSFNQLVLSPLSMFLSSGYSERSSEGYSKAAPINGQPGFERWNNDSRQGDVTVVVGNRFIVSAKGHNIEKIDPVRALVQSVDLGKLGALR